MRICLYTHTALPLLGGQELVVDALARHFVRAGHEVAVLAPRPLYFARRLGDGALPYAVVRHPRFLDPIRLLQWYRWWLLRLGRRRRFDVVHSHGIYPCGWLAALCRRQLGCPLVITSHGEGAPASDPRLTNPEFRRRHVQALEQSDALIAISPFTHEGYVQLCPSVRERIVSLPSGVEFEEFDTLAARPRSLDAGIRERDYVLFLGRLDPRKGADVLLRALALVPPSGRVELVIAGDGRQRTFLESLVLDLELCDRVRFVGTVRGFMRTYLLQNALCLVVPSVGWEGQGLVVLESYAAGRPVIASELPGFAGLVRGGETGWTVPAGSPQGLAPVLQEVLSGQAPLARLGSRARLLAARYDWRAVAQQHLGLYAELLHTRSVSRLGCAA